jgi:CRISPR/Cas system-associated exonuclease Cas4 (RecB family)
MFEIKPEKVSVLAPLLDYAVQQKVQTWPTFDGKNLDRSRYVSASEIGYCARRVWFSKNLPLAEGKFSWGFAERGHGHEAWIVGKLNSVETEYKWMLTGSEQVSVYHGYQSGTPDGLYSVNGKNVVVDFKSVDPRTNLSNLPKKQHIWQVVQNADLIEACFDMPVDGALLAYSDASDFSKITEYYFDLTSPNAGELMIWLERRAEQIMTTSRAGDVEPEGLYDGGCKTCPFGGQCSASVMQSKKERNRYVEIEAKVASVFG